jgi:guanylate kinase
MDKTMSKHQGLIFIISAPSGAGKTSLVKALVAETPNISVAISHTTRAKRPGELAGVHYHYVTLEQFAELQNQGAFIESAEVFQHWYATAKSAIMDVVNRGEDVILEIDWQGAEQVRKLFPENSVSIFILPPSPQALKHRLEQRAQDKPEVIAKRLAAAKTEIAHYVEFDYLVVNDDFKMALADLMAIVRSSRLGINEQQHNCRRLLQDLLA